MSWHQWAPRNDMLVPNNIQKFFEGCASPGLQKKKKNAVRHKHDKYISASCLESRHKTRLGKWNVQRPPPKNA